MVEKEENNKTENKPAGDKSIPSPKNEKKETAEEKAAKEAAAKAVEIEREKQINDHYIQIANNMMKLNHYNYNIRVLIQ